MRMHEQVVWKGGPSVPMAIWFLVFLAVVGGVIYVWMGPGAPLYVPFIPIFLGLMNLLMMQTTEYELTTERLITQKGIFSKTIDELELYRIRDFQIKQPFYLRIYGLSNVVLLTLDQSTPVLELYAVPNARSLSDTIRRLVEERRDAKGVRAVDFGRPM
jgi:uncharacterized membrane protein YdbT with pleckstrin-like domain